MSRPLPTALRLLRVLLRILIVLNPILGVAILGLIVFSLVAETRLLEAFDLVDNPSVLHALRHVAVIGVAAVPINHIILKRLIEIVEAVREGDPFVVENAARLRAIGWALLALEVMRIGIALFGAVSVDLEITGWIAVLMMFVLAHVFEYGARLRADLEGTV